MINCIATSSVDYMHTAKYSMVARDEGVMNHDNGSTCELYVGGTH